MYKIGEFSKMAQVTTKMLKYYEQCGLIKPIMLERVSGYRYYGVEQLIPVCKIRTFLDMGFSTVEIKDMLISENNILYFECKIDELKKESDENMRKMNLLYFYKDIVKTGEFNQKYRVSIKTIGNKTVASKRLILPSIFELSKSWELHYEKVNDTNCKIKAFPNCLTLFHDSEYILENNDVELLLFIDKKGSDSKNFEYKLLDEFKAVSVIHNGRYDFLNEAYTFAYRWIELNGYKKIGNPMESYLKSIYNTSNEDEYITEVLIPIQ